MPDYRKLGLFQRYAVERSDGKPLDEGEATFTLRFDKDDPWGQACRDTLRDFAARIQRIGYGPLADGLTARIEEVEARLREERQLAPQPLPPL